MCLIATDTMLINTKHVALVELNNKSTGKTSLDVAFSSGMGKTLYLTTVFEGDEEDMKTSLIHISKNWFDDTKVVTLSNKPKVEIKSEDAK